MDSLFRERHFHYVFGRLKRVRPSPSRVGQRGMNTTGLLYEYNSGNDQCRALHVVIHSLRCRVLAVIVRSPRGQQPSQTIINSFAPVLCCHIIKIFTTTGDIICQVTITTCVGMFYKSTFLASLSLPLSLSVCMRVCALSSCMQYDSTTFGLIHFTSAAHFFTESTGRIESVVQNDSDISLVPKFVGNIVPQQEGLTRRKDHFFSSRRLFSGIRWYLRNIYKYAFSQYLIMLRLPAVLA